MAVRDLQDLKPKPQHPTQSNRPQPTPTGSADSEQRAIAIGTAAANSTRIAVNEQIDHIDGMQEAYAAAIAPVADEASDFLASAISGELLWQRIAEQTQEKLDKLPKPQAVEFQVKSLPKLSFKRSEVKPNRYLNSGATAFPDGSTHAIPG